MRKLLFSLFIVILGLILIKAQAFAATYSSYLQPNSCTTGPDGGTQASTFIVDKFVGSTTQYFCFNPNIGSYYTQGNSCTLSPLNLDSNADNISGHTYLVRKRTDSSGHTIYDCVADCTRYPNFPNCPVTNPVPKGNLDSASCNANGVAGWTCDASNYNQALEVNFYLDGQAGTGGTPFGSTTAGNQRESQVGDQCGGNVNHGFQWSLSSGQVNVFDGKQHTLYAYAINTPSDPTHNPLLNPSGTTFTCAPTVAPPTNTSPSPNMSPAPSQPHTLLNIALQFPGIGGSGGNLSPKHPTRQVHISIYAADADPTQPNIAPIFDSKTVNVTFNSNSGYFTNPSVDVGTLPTGDYQILFKSAGYLRKEVVIPADQTNSISITGGTTNQIPATALNSGDDAPPYNVMDQADFYAIVDCYKDKATTSTCAAGNTITDLNDDGTIDGIDLNVWLRSYQAISVNAPSADGGQIPGNGVAGD